jgi:transcriptional regulator with XRE-family HTH domain
MELFSKRLRERARLLGLAEVARRAGLSERRYGHYVTGEREPNLETLIRISAVLGTTPDGLLLLQVADAQSARNRSITRIQTVAENLNDDDLELAAAQIECIRAQRGRGA